jgi:hypothetical protein
MPMLECTYFVDKGLYRFESKSARDQFCGDPQFSFEFDSSNLDEPEEACEAFGVATVEPRFPDALPRFNTTFLQADHDDDHCCYVSTEVVVLFDYHSPLDNLQEWIEEHADDMAFCGRISCKGEDGIDGTEGEGFIWPWNT